MRVGAISGFLWGSGGLKILMRTATSAKQLIQGLRKTTVAQAAAPAVPVAATFAG